MPVTLLRKLVDAISIEEGQIQIAGPAGQRPNIAIVNIEKGGQGTPIGRIRRASDMQLKHKIVIDRTDTLRREHLDRLAVMEIEENKPTCMFGHLAKLVWRASAAEPFENVENSYLIYPKGMDEDRLWSVHLEILQEKYYEALRRKAEKDTQVALVKGPKEDYDEAVRDLYDIEIDDTVKPSRIYQTFVIARRDGVPLCDSDWLFLRRYFDWVPPGPKADTMRKIPNRWIIPIKPKRLDRRS